MTKRVFGAGLIAADHVFLWKGRSSQPKYLGTSGGGSIGNTHCLLSLLGYECEVFGVVGNDYVADIMRSDFDVFHVSHRFVRRRGRPSRIVSTRQYSHLIDESKPAHKFKRKCLACGKGFKRQYQLSAGDLKDDVRNAARASNAIHVDRANRVTISLASEGEASGVPVAVDLGYSVFKRGNVVKELLGKATLVKTNTDIFRNLLGVDGSLGIGKWQEMFPKVRTLIVTDGANGVYGYSASASRVFRFKEDAIHCSRVRDQGGAGDVLMAIAISELLLGRAKRSKKEIIESINRGQALASLSCSLYGARSLQRVLLKEEIDRRAILSIADQIIEDGEAGSPLDPGIGIPEKFGYPFRFSPESSCSICGIPKRERSKKKSIAKQSVYIAELGQSFLAMSESFEIGMDKRGELDVFRKRPVIFIGSGGSLSAAHFGAQLLLKLYGLPATAISPFHLENIQVLNAETPVCILSYGGSNSDIVTGAAVRIAEAEVEDCLVLCGDKNSDLAGLASNKKWKTIDLPGQQRGFVSTVGMLAMISSLTSLLVPPNMTRQTSRMFEHEHLMGMLGGAERTAAEQAKLIDKSANNLHMVCLASGWGMPALADFESKIVEGGICTIETSEMKNFTHGRYLNTFYNRRSRAMIIFESPEERELSTFIQRKFERYVHPTIAVRTEESSVSGAIELMMKSLYLAWHIGQRRGRDIGSPHRYPPEARGLYGWEPKYRRGRDFRVLLKKT